jgi:hypothetical protein
MKIIDQHGIELELTLIKKNKEIYNGIDVDITREAGNFN